MTQPTPSPALPAVPQGVPAWLIRAVAAIVAIAGPLIAFVDPAATRFTAAIKAAIILVFLVVAAIIFLIHLILAAVHEYGWTMNAVTHVETDAEAEFKQLWPEMKQAYTDAAPVLEQVHGVSGVIDTLSKDVADLKAREAATGLDPQAVLQAVEAATGTTLPRATVPADPAVTAQAS